jgi:hypothetical protein
MHEIGAAEIVVKQPHGAEKIRGMIERKIVA